MGTDREHPLLKQVYDHYDYLRKLTEKRFQDTVLAEEAYSYAFDGLAQDDWRRVRAFEEKSSFRGYIGCVWCRLLEDFAAKKFGKITPPQWIRNLGGVWEELFKLLCCRRFSLTESLEEINVRGLYNCDIKTLEKTAREILARIPDCGKEIGPAFSIDDDSHQGSGKHSFSDHLVLPDEIVINKEKWIALQALTNVFFKSTNDDSQEARHEEKVIFLVAAIRGRLQLNEEEQLMLTAHFVDGESITMVGKRLGLNQNQIHGQFRRLMSKIRETLPELLEPYF